MIKRGNILVIGNSGVGKSTLINAVCGKEVAVTSWGTKGTTKELRIYESQKTPFRMIDTVGFEPGFLKERQAIQAVRNWSKQSMKDGKEDYQIHGIWFCVDGTATKLFSQTIKNLLRATQIYRSVPIVVVITKAYSKPDREKSMKFVYSAFGEHKLAIPKVIPVVAETYVLNETTYVAPEGITELIDLTNQLIPHGMRAAQQDIHKFKLNRKRAMAHSVVAASTAGGIVVGAAPLPLADAVILSSIELGEIGAIAQIYGIRKDENSKKLIAAMVEVGTVSMAARAAIGALKAVPGINLGASVINAIIAGSIVAAIGEGSIYVFEQIALGKKTVADVEWVIQIIESKLNTEFISKVTSILSSITKGASKKDIVEATFYHWGMKSN